MRRRRRKSSGPASSGSRSPRPWRAPLRDRDRPPPGPTTGEPCRSSRRCRARRHRGGELAGRRRRRVRLRRLPAVGAPTPRRPPPGAGAGVTVSRDRHDHVPRSPVRGQRLDQLAECPRRGRAPSLGVRRRAHGRQGLRRRGLLLGCPRVVARGRPAPGARPRRGPRGRRKRRCEPWSTRCFRPRDRGARRGGTGGDRDPGRARPSRRRARPGVRRGRRPRRGPRRGLGVRGVGGRRVYCAGPTAR